MWLYAGVPTEAFRSWARVREGHRASWTPCGGQQRPAARAGRHPRPRAAAGHAEQRQTTNRGDLISTKEATIELEGEVTEALRNGMFRIKLDNGHETIGYVAGKMRRYRIRIMLGDRIKIELSPYDLNRGRIVYRYK